MGVKGHDVNINSSIDSPSKCLLTLQFQLETSKLARPEPDLYEKQREEAEVLFFLETWI